MADDGLARKLDQFEDEQLKSLDIQDDASDSEVVLKQAKDIGLISDAVIDKIEKTGLKDKLASSFVAAKKKAEGQMSNTEKDPQKARAKAFRTAFRLVYGKFLLEHQDYALEDPNGSVMETLKKVLKFPLEKSSLRGRTELIAAMSRLRNSSYQNMISSLDGIQMAFDAFSFKTFKDFVDYFEKNIEQMMSDKSIDQDSKNLCESHLNEYKSLKTDAEFQAFFENKIKLFLENLKSQFDLSKSKKRSSRSGVEVNKNLLRIFDKVQRTYETLNHPFDRHLNNVESDIKKIAEAAGLSLETKKICEDFLSKYEGVKQRVLRLYQTAQVDNAQAEFTNFLEPFIKELKERLVKEPDAAKSLVNATAILEKAFGKRKTLEEMKALELKSQEAEAKKKAIQEGYDLITGDDFKVPKDVHTKYIALKEVTDMKVLDENGKNVKDASGKDVEVPLTAKSLRETEALDAKMKERKEEFGKMKDLFSDSKTADLNGAFLKLGEFREAYDESKQDIDIEGEGSTKFDKALSILSGQLASYKAKYDKEPVKKYAGAEKSEAETKVFELGPKVEYLKEVKDKREKYKEKAEALIKELREYLIKCKKAFEFGLTESSGSFDKVAVDENRKKLDNINVSTGANIDDLQSVYTFLKPHFGTVLTYATEQQKNQELGVKESKVAKDKKDDLKKAETLHADLKPLVDKIKKAADLGVDAKFKDPSKTATDMKKEFDDIKPEDAYFDAGKLVEFYEKYFAQLFDTTDHKKEFVQKFARKLTGLEEEVKAANRELTLAKEAAEKYKNLTDAQAAKRIIGVLVAEQFPELSIIERNKLVTMILAGDVATLQTEEDYEQLANRAGAVEFDALHEVGLRGKLIAFQYKEGDKVVQPFKGLKPEDFKDWAHIEKLFNIEKLNHKNGFFLLAALEIFDQVKDPDGKVRSMQALRVEEKLKALLAKQLGVHERMDEAGISKIIDEAFKEQMKKVRPLVKAHFDNYGEKGDEFKQHKTELLNLKYEELTDKLRNKKINQEIYEVKLKALIKEAVEADVDGQVKFSQDSVAAGYWNSSEAQWIRDKAHDAGAFVGKKAAAVALGAPALIGLKGAWGATKLGASLGFHTVMFPFRAAKYPLIALAKPGIWAINLFRKTPWQPLPTIRAALSNDVGRVVGYGKQKAGETLQGATKAVTETPATMWKKVAWKSTKYADRTKEEAELRTEQMKVLEEKAALTPVEVASSPFIDLAEYKEKIKALNEMVGAKTAFPAGHDVSAGHTEKAGEKKTEAHGKDDHGHGKEAAGGHHS